MKDSETSRQTHNTGSESCSSLRQIKLSSSTVVTLDSSDGSFMMSSVVFVFVDVRLVILAQTLLNLLTGSLQIVCRESFNAPKGWMLHFRLKSNIHFSAAISAAPDQERATVPLGVAASYCTGNMDDLELFVMQKNLHESLWIRYFISFDCHVGWG